MEKPTETREWTQKDIDDVIQKLPEGVNFGSLSPSHKSSLTIDIGTGIQWEQMNSKIQSVENSLENAGVNICNIIVKAGYSGTKSPHLLLEVEMK